ncbi:MAG TPA: glycosyltransferase family 2 protein [Steroidobacteraceae bacterium]|nr:glycosyltransferase family 2 protein [Steroidobacteraceae bacterium]
MSPHVPAAGAMFNPCIVIPFYNHAGSIAEVVAGLKSLGLHCYLVNDGSDASCDAVLTRLASEESHWLRVISYQPNQGKGMAVMTGMEAAARDGYTHVAQIDADGQHRVADLAVLLGRARNHPEAMITGFGEFDASVPRSRLYGRYITHVWVWINTLSLQVRDSMCGLRVYPVAPALAIWRNHRLGTRMSFDIEILVRLCWRGIRIINVAVPVTYPLDGVSHFKVLRDNLQISAAHARMFAGMLWRSPLLLWHNVRRWTSSARPVVQEHAS